MFCGYCGKEVSEELNFCVYCGKKLVKPGEAVNTASKTGGSTSVPKTGSGASAPKTGGNTSASKTGSSTSTTKTGNSTVASKNAGSAASRTGSTTASGTYRTTSGTSAAGTKKDTYSVVFNRPSRFTSILVAFNIKIDGGLQSYRLENGESIEVRLTPGRHIITFSLFSYPRKTEITLNVDRDRKLTCYTPLKNALISPLITKPVVVEDEHGMELS